MRLAEFGRNKQRCLIGALGMFILAVMCVPVAESQEGNGVLRSRSYKLNYITSGRALEMLSELKLGTDYDALTEQVLIVTSNSSADLNKVTEVMTLLDSELPASIRVLGTKGPQRSLPSPDLLIDRLNTITAGTMADAPPRGTANPAIIDMLDESLIAIGNQTVMGEIQAAFDAWVAENPPAPVKPVVAPVQETPTETRPAEKAVDEPAVEAKPTAEPTEPAVAEKAPVKTGEAEEKAVPGATDMEEAVTLERLAEKLMGAEKTPTPETAEPAKEIEPVQEIEAVKPVETVKEIPVVTETLTETEDVVVEDVPIEEMVEEPDVDAFMEEGLLETLEKEVANKEARLAAEKAALEAAAEEVVEVKPAQEATPVETAPIEESTSMSKAARERAEAIARMQAQAEAERKAAEQTQAGANDELKKALEALLGPAAVKPVEEPVEPELSPAEQEIAMLKAQIAELQAAKAVQGKAPAGTPAKKGSAIPAEKADEEADVEPEPETESMTTFEEAIGDEMLDTVIDLPQEVELEALVDLVGKQLGLNYLYDSNIFKTKPKVTLKIHEGKIKVRDLYALLESIMRSQNFIMTRNGRFVEIYDQKGAAKADAVFRGAEDPIQPGDVIVQTVFDVENIDAADALKTLTGMKLISAGIGEIQQVSGSNMLVIKDYAYRMPRIQEALDLIDIEGEPKEFEYRQLKYMQAEDLVAKLKTLIAEMEGVSLQVSGGTTPAAQPATRQVRTRDPATGRIVTKNVPVTTSAPGAAPAADKGAVFIDVDERTNRILMIGKRAELDTLNQLIDTLDVPQQDLKSVREYVIQHVEAMEVVNVLNELGLATVSVSTTTQAATSGRTATPSRTPTPNTPTPRAVPSSAAKSSGAEPNISIRPATNSLLVNATGEQHAAIELVIAHVDVVQKDQRTIREYEIQFVDAQEIIDTMTDLGMISSQSVSGGSSSRSSTSRSTSSRSTSRSTPPAAANAEAAPTMDLAGLTGEEGTSITEQQPQISILEATNSLLVYATPRQHKAIAMLMAHADRVPETTTTPYVVYGLESQEPGKLAETLEKIVLARQGDNAQTKTSAASKVQGSTAASASSSPVPNLPNLEEENIRIIPDEDSYSLIVYANKRNQQWIGELIRELDEYRPQVLLDCTLVEIFKQDDFNFDLNVLNSVPDLTYTSGITGSVTEGITKDDILDKLLDPTSDRKRFIDMQSNSGSFTGFYGDDKVMALLTAMQTKDYGRVLANPKLLVDDNKEGTITTSTTTYVTRTTTNYQNTQSGDPIQTTNTEFDPYDASIMMSITPHISKGENLQLIINLTRSDFLSIDQTGASPPDQSKSDVNTEVTVPNNATIILGGMDKINQGKGGEKVPILGDLPFVGGLFRSTSNSSYQSKLYVFVKAHILRPGDDLSSQDLKNISNEYRRRFEQDEMEMQKYEDWPGIKPKPMQPDSVLQDGFEGEDEVISETSKTM